MVPRPAGPTLDSLVPVAFITSLQTQRLHPRLSGLRGTRSPAAIMEQSWSFSAPGVGMCLEHVLQLILLSW